MDWAAISWIKLFRGRLFSGHLSDESSYLYYNVTTFTYLVLTYLLGAYLVSNNPFPDDVFARILPTTYYSVRAWHLANSEEQKKRFALLESCC